MSDRVFFVLAAVAALAMIGLALQWPQGIGAQAWGPLGHPIEPQMRPSVAGQAPGTGQ